MEQYKKNKIMPNHVANIVTLTGSEESIRNLVEFVRSDEQIFDFNKIIPMPETFEKYDTTNHADGRQMTVGKPLNWSGGPAVTEELIEEYKRATKEQMDKYGVVGWYDWRRKYWGTKWNAYDIEFNGRDEFTFNTAWCAPEPVIRALSKMFPAVLIRFVYADEDWGNNCGEGVLKAGRGGIYCPDGGSDDAMQLYFETHPYEEEFFEKDENGEWMYKDED